MKLNLTFIILISLVIGAGVVFVKIYDEKREINNNQGVISSVDSIKYELSFVEDDLHTLGVSKYVQDTILETIDSCSSEYKLPIGLLHSIFRVESEYRFYIDHPVVNIKVKNSLISTRAIGLSGIIWEFWEDSLKKHNIAETRSDLYLPEINIRAASYILRYMIDDEMKKKQTQYSLLNNVVRRYYGAYSEEYMKKMEKVTSDLWMRRMSVELLRGNK